MNNETPARSCTRKATDRLDVLDLLERKGALVWRHQGSPGDRRAGPLRRHQLHTHRAVLARRCRRGPGGRSPRRDRGQKARGAGAL